MATFTLDAPAEPAARDTPTGGKTFTLDAAPSKPGSNVLSRTASNVAGIADLFLSLPSMALGVGADIGARSAAAGSGETRRIGAQAGQEAYRSISEPISSPVGKLMSVLGYEEDYKKSDVSKGMETFSKWIEKGGDWIEQHTGGALLKEDVQSLTNILMLAGGARGVDAAMAAKPRPSAYAGPAKVLETTLDHAEDFKDWLNVEGVPAKPARGTKSPEIAVEEGYRAKTTPGVFQIGTAEETGIRPEGKLRQTKLGPYDSLPGGTLPRIEDEVPGVPSKEQLLAEARARSPGEPGMKGEAGKADPVVLGRIAAVGGGAAAGAYLDKDNPVIGAIIGGIGGILATKAGRAAMERWKESPAEGQAAAWLSDRLYQLTQQGHERMIKGLQYLKAVVPADYKTHAETIYHSFEDKSVRLTQRQQLLRDTLIKPVQESNSKLRSSLEALGVDVGPEIERDYVHRIAKGQRSSVFEEIERSYPTGRALPQTTSSLMEREAYAIETPTGNREIITMEPGNRFFVHRDGKVVGRGTYKPSQPEVEWGGQTWKRGQATTQEIEANTKIRYYKDAIGTELDNNIRLSTALRNAQFLDKLKNLPSFSDMAVRIKDRAPADWRTVDIPQLKGYKFAPRMANVLDDFKGEMAKHPAETLGKISRILTGSLFYNPLIHELNVLLHDVIQRGLSAWVTPSGYVRLAKTIIPAWKAVFQQDASYLKFMHEGAGLMYPNVLLRDFSGKVMQQLGHTPEIGPVAKAFGYANPVEMVRRIYRLSRENLWAINDVIMMRAYFEKQLQGQNIQSAIKQVERHIPNYRTPDRIAGSRLISQAMQSPFFTAFGRYDYGRLHSYGEMIKDLIGKHVPLADRAKALDQMAMVGVVTFAVYPLVMDKVVQALTGNKNAEAGRFGPATIPYLLYEYFHQKQDLNQVVRSAVPVGPMLNAAVEIYSNRDTFTGGKLFKSGQDAFSFIAKQLSPLYTATRVQEGKITPKEAVFQQLGVRFPKTPEERKLRRDLERALHGRKVGYEPGQTERLYTGKSSVSDTSGPYPPVGTGQMGRYQQLEERSRQEGGSLQDLVETARDRAAMRFRRRRFRDVHSPDSPLPDKLRM